MKASVAALGILVASVSHAQHLTSPADTLQPDDARIANGHDPKRLIAAAMKFKPKSEFESAADYDARAQQYGALRVYGDVSLSGKVALNVGLVSAANEGKDLGYKYDADSGTLSVCLPWAGRRYLKEGGSTWDATEVWLSKNVTKTGSYVGRNAFGARAQVQAQRLTGARLIVPRAKFRANCTTPVEMPASEAQRALYTASLVLVGRFVPPFGEKFEDFDAATIDDPIEQTTALDEAPFLIEELVLVSKGRVIYRQPAPERSRAF